MFTLNLCRCWRHIFRSFLSSWTIVKDLQKATGSPLPGCAYTCPAWMLLSKDSSLTLIMTKNSCWRQLQQGRLKKLLFLYIWIWKKPYTLPLFFCFCFLLKHKLSRRLTKRTWSPAFPAWIPCRLPMQNILYQVKAIRFSANKQFRSPLFLWICTSTK